MNVSRRGFLQGCSAAIAAMSGARLHSTVFGNPEEEPNQQILITVFLRGGMDVLNLLPPISGTDRGYYEAERDDIMVPAADTLNIGSLTGPNGEIGFGLHPYAKTIASNDIAVPTRAGLDTLFSADKLAIIHATGMNEDTRSHFDAMSYIENGTPGDKSTVSGWIARHLQSAPNLPTSILMPAVAMGSSAPQSFATSPEVLAMQSTDSFGMNGYSLWKNAQRQALRRVYGQNTTMVHAAGLQALNASDLISLNASNEYTPETTATYPNSSFADQLKTIAQMVKLEMGLRMATVDLGGWDTHDAQGENGGGYFAGKIRDLSESLTAFYNDLNTSARNAPINRVTVVVMTEFGRRLRQNADRGTDHGHGGAMMVLGGEVNGGLYGNWPGLHTDQLYDNADLAVTTDYRQVLSEVLIRRHENPNLGVVFPGYTDYTPMGLVQGQDRTPNYAINSVPTAVAVKSTEAAGQTASAIMTAAGVGVAATAGLVALRNRGTE